MKLIITTLIIFLSLSVKGQGLKVKAEQEIVEQFKEYVSLNFQKLKIPKEIKKEIEENAKQRFFRSEVYHWEVFYKDSLIANAYLDNVLGRTQPITFLVILDLDGNIKYNSIVKYRSHKGGAVKNRSWLEQFIGKNSTSGFKVGSDIQAVSGATYSVRSLTRGFNKILLLHQKIVGK